MANSIKDRKCFHENLKDRNCHDDKILPKNCRTKEKKLILSHKNMKYLVCAWVKNSKRIEEIDKKLVLQRLE